jgi:hypothetical protein
MANQHISRIVLRVIGVFDLLGEHLVGVKENRPEDEHNLLSWAHVHVLEIHLLPEFPSDGDNFAPVCAVEPHYFSEQLDIIR